MHIPQLDVIYCDLDTDSCMGTLLLDSESIHRRGERRQRSHFLKKKKKLWEKFSK